MGLTARFSNNDLNKMLLKGLQQIEDAIVQRLMLLGEKCVNKAREEGAYKNQTGNLRNSIGYIVLKHNQVVSENFERVVEGKEQSDQNPLEIARNFALEKGRELALNNDYVLVVVAGMEYARDVEDRGLDVLTSVEQFAEEKFPIMMAQLKRNIDEIFQ